MISAAFSSVAFFSRIASRQRQRDPSALSRSCVPDRRTLCRRMALFLFLILPFSLLNAHESAIVNRTQLPVGDAPASNTLHDRVESSPVVQLPLVVAPA